MLIRTANGVVFSSDWTRDNIGAAHRNKAPLTTGCDLFVQDVFCRPIPPKLLEPKPVADSPYMDQLELLLNP